MLRHAEVMEALRETVDAVPLDYRGGFCQYLSRGTGKRCLVGEVLFKLEPEAFEKIVAEYNGMDIEALILDGVVQSESDDLTAFLNKVQSLQDSGYAWHRIAQKLGF